MIKKPKKKVGHYHLMEIIGRGAYADVYASIDTKNNQILAIKCISKTKLKDDDKVNLRRELEILHKMKHPNIVGIKNYLENQKNHYIMLEYCNGLDLDAYLKKYMSEYKRPLNELYIQKIMQQIAPAMEYMHSNNIIHRDIKLQNILLNFDSHLNVTINGQLPPKLTFKQMSLDKPFSVKITDLGFAKDLVKDSEGSTILGSPIYMSPDILARADGSNTKKYNTSVDLWSLGVITYELLTGSTPFLGNSIEEVFKNISKGVYSLPKNLKASIEIISFINGLLQYYPEKRLNWKQINSHPFLTKNANDFTYIDLEMVNEKEKFEIDTKNSDNLLWALFKNNNLNVKIDKINQEEAKKPEVKKAIDKNKVINEEVRKALEKEREELEKEKKKIKEMKAQAEEEKKKAEIAKIHSKKEQEKLINEENKIKNMKDKLIKDNENTNKNTEEKNKKLKELELQLEKIKQDKDNMDNKLKNIEQKISETERIKKLAEKQINNISKENKGNNNLDLYKKELDKLVEEKAQMENEMKKLKDNQKVKEDDYKKENDNLQKKMKEITEQKKNLEKEVKDNNVEEKLKNTNNQMENLEKEIKKIEEEKEKQIKNIQNEKENLEKQINEYSKIIKKREQEEEERQKKGIFMSCVDLNKEDIEKQEELEKKEKEEKEKEEKEEKEKEEKEGKEEKQDDDDEWEEITDIESDEEEKDIEIDEFILDDYEIVENYVDIEMNKIKTS